MNATRRLLLCLLLTPVLAYLEFTLLRLVLALTLWSAEGLGDFPSPAQVWGDSPEIAVILVAISLAQLASLLLPLPVEPAKGAPAPILARAVLAGFVVTAAIAIPVVALLDLPTWLTPEGEALRSHGKEVMHAVVATWAITWLGFAALLTHRGAQEPDRLERAVRQATTGTAVGLALATPWYLALRRRQQCVCALGTFYALVLGIWSLIVVAGPFLLFARRDRRRTPAV